MATGRRNTPLVRPYEQRTLPSGTYGTRAHGVRYDDSLARAIADAGNTVMHMQAEQLEQKMDQYDLWLADEEKRTNGLVAATADPAKKAEIQNSFINNANNFGKELLGEEGLSKWSESPKHGYNYWNRYQYSVEVGKAKDAYNQGRDLAVLNAGKYAQMAMSETNQDKQKQYMDKADSILSNTAYFTPAEMQEKKASVWKTAATDHFYSVLKSNPDQALAMSKEEWFANAIQDPKEVDGMINQARNKSMELYYDKRVDGVISQAKRSNGIAMRLMDGEEVSQSEIDASIPEGIDRDIIYKMAHLTKDSTSGSGLGREQQLEVLVRLDSQFKKLFTKKPTYDTKATSDVVFREGSEQYLSEASEFEKAVYEAYNMKAISAEKAKTYLTSVGLAFYDVSVDEKRRGRMSKGANAFATAFEQIDAALDEYSINSPAIRAEVSDAFTDSFNKLLIENNFSAETFANASPEVKDNIIKQAREAAMANVVNLTPFASLRLNVPPSVQGQAETLYQQKAFRAKQEGRISNRFIGGAEKVDPKAMTEYMRQREEDNKLLGEMAKESYNEVIASIQRQAQEFQSIGRTVESDYLYSLKNKAEEAVKGLEEEERNRAQYEAEIEAEVARRKAERKAASDRIAEAMLRG